MERSIQCIKLAAMYMTAKSKKVSICKNIFPASAEKPSMASPALPVSKNSQENVIKTQLYTSSKISAMVSMKFRLWGMIIFFSRINDKVGSKRPYKTDKETQAKCPVLHFTGGINKGQPQANH